VRLPEAEQQCAVRAANEVLERRNMAPRGAAARMLLRCECGDPNCMVCVDITHTEYEAVRDYGSHFVITPNHENSENTSVLHENARFAVIDVVAGDARYRVMARNPRHAWVDARDWTSE
jgi:hypothetical protein